MFAIIYRRFLSTLFCLLALTSVEPASGADSRPEVIFQYQGPNPTGWTGPHLEDFTVLSDGTLAIVVSEGAIEFYLYQVSDDGRSIQRTYLGDGAGSTLIDRAVAPASVTTPAREFDANSPAQREHVFVANSFGQVWRVTPGGQIAWFTAVGPDFGLWLVTSMTVMRDGSILLGGRGDSDGPRWCGYDAQLVKLGSGGRPVWQWHFDLSSTWTYANLLLEVDGGYLIVVDTNGPGAEMGSSSNPCSDFSHRQWLAWLDSAGNPIRILRRPFSDPIESIALLPDGRIAATGVEREAKRVFLEFLAPDGTAAAARRSYAFAEVAGAPRDLVPYSIVASRVIDQRLYLFVDFVCLSDFHCPGWGTRAIALTLYGDVVSPPQMSTGALNGVTMLPDGSAYLQRRWDQILRVPLD